MNVTRPQLAEALHLLHQMLTDAEASWFEHHFSTWRSTL